MALESTRTLAQLSAYWEAHLPSSDWTDTPALSHLQPYLARELLDDRGKDRLGARAAWRAVLAGCAEGERPASLSLERSQHEYLCSEDAKTLKIERTWDVDSFLARVTTPAVHVDHFEFYVKPAFGSQWTQDARITFRGQKVHTMKQLRLGWSGSSRGRGFFWHVFFPHMPTSYDRPVSEPAARQRSQIDLTTMLTQSQQAVWLDRIVFPALAASCPSQVKQHWPTSSADVFSKAKVKGEKYITGQDGDIDLHYSIPGEYVEAFWAAVLANAQDATCRHFNDPLFVLVAHDLKLRTMRRTPAQARDAFVALMKSTFTYHEETFPPDDQWLDFGSEDTPTDRPGPGVTLLRRRSCLEHWVQRWACPQSSGATKSTARFWNWAMTRDAGSADLELGTTNVLRQHGGMAYFKAYNIAKNLFTTPLKDYMPFDNPQFESLVFSDQMREEWYRANAGRGPSISRTATLGRFLESKQRLHSAFVGPCSPHGTRVFGVRQEYRIKIRTFHDLHLDNEPCCLAPAHEGDSPVQMVPSSLPQSILGRWAGQVFGFARPFPAASAPPLPAATHLPFWILPTSDVMDFAARELGRWILAAESLLYSLSSPVPEADQLLYSVAVGIFLRSLRLSVCGLHAPRAAAMWLTTLKAGKHQRRRGRPVKSESDPEGPRKRGLGYQDCLERTGMMWLPSDMFTWLPHPHVTPEAFQSIGLPGNALQQSLRRGNRVELQMRMLNGLHRCFHARLQKVTDPLLASDDALDQRQQVFRLGAELVVAAFVGDVFHLLACREFNVQGAKDWQLQRLVQDLTPDESKGLCGLTYNMLAKVLGQAPRLSRALPSTSGQTNRNGTAKAFAQYNTGRWADKVFGLFAWHPGKDRTPGWLNYPFRRLQDRLCGIIRATVDDNAVEEFRDRVKTTAAHHLWIIPQYTTSTMSHLWKAQPGTCSETATKMKQVSALHRTNWHIPCLPFPHEIDTESEASDSDDDDGLNLKQRSARHRLCQSSLPLLSIKDRRDPEVNSDESETGAVYIPKDPSEFGLRFRLTLAADVWAEVSQQTMVV